MELSAKKLGHARGERRETVRCVSRGRGGALRKRRKPLHRRKQGGRDEDGCSSEKEDDPARIYLIFRKNEPRHGTANGPLVRDLRVPRFENRGLDEALLPSTLVCTVREHR
ncbi:hypothetical protein MRX96_036760 [Rhipicephalus microplus]